MPTSNMSLANLLTLARVLLIPFFVFFFYQAGGAPVAAVIFLIASLTDTLDGYLARRRLEVTQLGKFMDPIADKLLILSALFLLVGSGDVPAWMAIIIIGRELAITGLRAIAAVDGIVMAAEKAGKYKVVLQSISILCLLMGGPIGVQGLRLHEVGLLLLTLSMVVAVVSAWQYFIKFGQQIQWGNP